MFRKSEVYKDPTVIICQQFSPDGEFLVCANDQGEMGIFDMSELQEPRRLYDEDKNIMIVLLRAHHKLPYVEAKAKFFNPNKEKVCSMTSNSTYCIVGAVGMIYAYSWETIEKLKPEMYWRIFLPESSNGISDVNSLHIIQQNCINLLHAAYGDNKIHIFSLDNGKIVGSLGGHTEYIHALSSSSTLLASCSEDGSVRLWDRRSKAYVFSLEPDTSPTLSRPHLGKWIADVDLDNHFLICGGGPRAALWDVRFAAFVHCFVPVVDNGIHVTKFIACSAFIGGNSPYFYRCTFGSRLLSQMRIPLSVAYSAVYSSDPYKYLAVCGTSPMIYLSRDLSQFSKTLDFDED